MKPEELLQAAAVSTSESSMIDFKSAFDPTQRGDWCELIKDIVAMANSGGGCIVLGVNDDGTRSAWDPAPFTNLDPAQISDQLRKYVEGLEDKVQSQPVTRGTDGVPAVLIGATSIPRVFTNPGTYEKTPGRSAQAFPKGGLYFRHGTKSEPAEQADLASAIERAIDCVREKWLGNIRQVMEAPAGARFQMITSEVRASTEETAIPIRVVPDLSAPVYRFVNPDQTHPFRQKELLKVVNEKLAGAKLNSFDVQCIRRSLAAEGSHPEFFHEPKYGGSKQYSQGFVDYVVGSCANDPAFISQARKTGAPKP